MEEVLGKKVLVIIAIILIIFLSGCSIVYILQAIEAGSLKISNWCVEYRSDLKDSLICWVIAWAAISFVFGMPLIILLNED